MTTYSMAITQEAAAEQALQLYKQKVKYEDIANHLKKIGYVSSRTRKPITGQAARWMIMEELKKRGEPVSRNEVAASDTKPTPTIPMQDAPDTIWVTKNSDAAPVQPTVLSNDIVAVRMVLSLDIAAESKLKLISALVN